MILRRGGARRQRVAVVGIKLERPFKQAVSRVGFFLRNDSLPRFLQQRQDGPPMPTNTRRTKPQQGAAGSMVR